MKENQDHFEILRKIVKKPQSTQRELAEELGFSLSFGGDCDRVLNDFLNSEDLTTGDTYFLGKASKHGPFVVVSEVRL